MNLNKLRTHRIDDNVMNRKLRELYMQIPTSFSQRVEEYNNRPHAKFKITNPWLMVASKDYYEAKRRIMFIGQESFTWLGEVNNGVYSDKNIPVLLSNFYDIFVNEKHGYKSPIWRKYREYISLRPDVGFIFNNVAKCGYNNKTTGFHETINKELSYMLRSEIEICKPNMILFFSGPKYDRYIDQRIHINKRTDCIKGVPTRMLCQLYFEDTTMPIAYRTYHPAYLQRINKHENVRKVYEFLKEKISTI